MRHRQCGTSVCRASVSSAVLRCCVAACVAELGSRGSRAAHKRAAGAARPAAPLSAGGPVTTCDPPLHHCAIWQVPPHTPPAPRPRQMHVPEMHHAGLRDHPTERRQRCASLFEPTSEHGLQNRPQLRHHILLDWPALEPCMPDRHRQQIEAVEAHRDRRAARPRRVHLDHPRIGMPRRQLHVAADSPYGTRTSLTIARIRRSVSDGAVPSIPDTRTVWSITRPVPIELQTEGRMPPEARALPWTRHRFGDQGTDHPGGDLLATRPRGASPAGTGQGRFAASGKPLTGTTRPGRDEPAPRGDHLQYHCLLGSTKAPPAHRHAILGPCRDTPSPTRSRAVSSWRSVSAKSGRSLPSATTEAGHRVRSGCTWTPTTAWNPTSKVRDLPEIQPSSVC